MSVVVVGSVNRDVVARVARIPGPGETVLASSLSRTGGGKGANQAVAAARAGGAAVAFVGAVGDDADGAALRDGLLADGIDVTGLVGVPGATGTALISVGDDGENAIVVVAGANAARSDLTSVQRERVGEADVLATQLEVPLALVTAAAAARRAGAWHVLNAAPSSPLVDAHVDAVDGLLADVDVLIVNEHELRDIAAMSSLEAVSLDAAVDAVAARVPALIVTLGADGCLVATPTGRRRIAAHPTRAVDTTGAGDTFCGVFAASLAASGASAGKADIEVFAAAARIASAAAALAVRSPGAQEAVPTVADVAGLLSEAGAAR
ncbi:PfkB family carbohydrate kinase [Microbacterium sp. P06]|uniref:PfkB family carbohydrate kinase n=1 Tax=Microbacterium sp. P06 TaxID=3366949 RepID=UPI003745BBB4